MTGDTTHTEQLQHLITQAQDLINTIAGGAATDEARDRTAFGIAYQLGYAAGHDVGYARAQHEQALYEQRLADINRDVPTSPSYAALQQLRAQPAGDAYQAAQARRGGRPYTGGATPPADDQTVDPWATLPTAAA